ncbi:hypothetical protein GNI_017340 [Gregarina niphandrodes]|uniref:Uncharacterized protein n=1 Tax=Gregarina niphandrodes TaxID=110365 RepID=A0A023BCA2_GRENI|nr:hypothetical protein GNI_017340 [Gregarina niphandrodes]EZG82127.1 hypothetical protein GNI_017340 [Gregarina niphandrodes]|eukprot:XP_011129033.1 hypothetical protein GNI_017340 [Gregarina niphandrodes]
MSKKRKQQSAGRVAGLEGEAKLVDVFVGDGDDFGAMKTYKADGATEASDGVTADEHAGAGSLMEVDETASDDTACAVCV